MDMAMVHTCHKLALPGSEFGRCMEPWSLIEIDALLRKNGRRNYIQQSYRHQSLVKMLPVIREMLSRWLIQSGASVQNTVSTEPFVLYSAHDTTLDPLLSTLGIGQGEWPPYASRLVFELVQAKNDQVSEYFIRILYNGEVVTNEVKFCEIVDAAAGLCRLQKFHNFFNDGYTKYTNENKRSTICSSSNV